MEPSYCYIGIEIPCFYRFYSIFNFYLQKNITLAILINNTFKTVQQSAKDKEDICRRADARQRYLTQDFTLWWAGLRCIILEDCYSTVKIKFLLYWRRMTPSSARRRNETQRWLRQLTTTQQMKNQSQYGGYLIFAVPGTAKISDAGLHSVMDWIVCSNLWNCYRMSSE